MAEIDFGGAASQILVAIIMSLTTMGLIVSISTLQDPQKRTRENWGWTALLLGLLTVMVYYCSSYFFSLGIGEEGLILRRSLFNPNITLRASQISSIQLVHYQYNKNRKGETDHWECEIELNSGELYRSLDGFDPSMIKNVFESLSRFQNRSVELKLVDLPHGVKHSLRYDEPYEEWIDNFELSRSLAPK